MLQGLAFDGNRCPEALIRVKIQTESSVKKEEVMPLTIAGEDIEGITTYFSKKNNIITGTSFLCFEYKPEESMMVRQTIDLNHFNEGWKEAGLVKRIVFTCEGQRLRPTAVELRLESHSNETTFVRIITTPSKHVTRSYYIKLSELVGGEKWEYEVVEILGEEEYQFRHQLLLPSTSKTQERYKDYSYWP